MVQVAHSSQLGVRYRQNISYQRDPRCAERFAVGGVKVLEKDLLQAWQKYSCGDMFASRVGNDTRILGFAADLIQTATAICDQNWFIMAESCRPFRMAPLRPWMCWTARLSRSRATSQMDLAFDARFFGWSPRKDDLWSCSCGYGWHLRCRRSVPGLSSPVGFNTMPLM